MSRQTYSQLRFAENMRHWALYGLQGGAPDEQPKQEPLPLDDKAKPDDTAALKARAEKAEADAAALRAKDKKRNDDESAAKKKAEEEEAKKRGEFEALMAKRDAELKAANEEAERLRVATQKRIDAGIAKLGDAAKKEIEIVRGSLSLDKLEELVTIKLGDVIANPPSPGVGTGRRDGSGGHKIDPGTEELLVEVSASTGARETAKKLGEFKRDGDSVFRWRGTGDDRKDTMSFVDMLNKIADNPIRDMREKARDRVLK